MEKIRTEDEEIGDKIVGLVVKLSIWNRFLMNKPQEQMKKNEWKSEWRNEIINERTNERTNERPGKRTG